ncbi:MAG: hypothetical protein NTX27_10270 [Verrucomicrobia bacterium]|nr:hypothetical protein [Verrucomicrobiota bacterium]
MKKLTESKPASDWWMQSHAGARISRFGVDRVTGGGQKNVYLFIVAPLTVRWRNNKNTYTLPGIIDIHGVVMLIKWD